MLVFKNYDPFMDEDGSGAGGEPESAKEPETNEGADGRKTGEDVKSEAQRIADAMVAKKLKGMPSKEELAAFKKWQSDQKTESEKLAEAQKAAETAASEAAAKEAKANAMIAAAAAGFKTNKISSAVTLAMARADDETSIEDAIKEVAKDNPEWVAGVDLPETGGNPAAGKKDKKEPPILI